MTLAFFILICNLIGLIPGFESPTAVPVVPLGCAVCAFIYYHAQGSKKGSALRRHFLRHFWVQMSLFIRVPLSILMLPIEIVSHLARMLSLTVRLYANMFAGDMVTMAFFSLVSDRRAGHLSGASYRRFVPANLYLHPADHGVPVRRGSGRALSYSF